MIQTAKMPTHVVFLIAGFVYYTGLIDIIHSLEPRLHERLVLPFVVFLLLLFSFSNKVYFFLLLKIGSSSRMYESGVVRRQAAPQKA